MPKRENAKVYTQTMEKSPTGTHYSMTILSQKQSSQSKLIENFCCEVKLEMYNTVSRLIKELVVKSGWGSSMKWGRHRHAPQTGNSFLHVYINDIVE